MKKIFITAILMLVISLLTYLTYERNKIWQNDITLWADVAEKAPSNSRAFVNLGRALAGKGRDVDAIEAFKKAVYILPSYALAYMNMAVSYGRLEMDGDAEYYYRKAMSLQPGLADAYYNYGFFLYSKQRYGEAYPVLQGYIRLSPTGIYVPFVYKLLMDMEHKGYGR